MDNHPNVHAYAFQEENGAKNGGLHFQIYVHLKEKKRKNAMVEMCMPCGFAREACSARPAKWKDALARYCQKLETRVSGPWTKNLDIPAPVEEEPPIWDPLEDVTPYPYQQLILDRYAEHKAAAKKDTRKIYWMWETTGNVGKSALTRHLALHNNILTVDSGKKEDIAQALKTLPKQPDLVIIDLPRAVKLPKTTASALEALKNGIIFSGKYESGSIILRQSPMVVVFANYPPPDGMFSVDRLEIHNITLPESEGGEGGGVAPSSGSPAFGEPPAV